MSAVRYDKFSMTGIYKPQTLDPSLAYPMINHDSLVASNLPIKLWLLGNSQQQYNIIITHH